MKNYRKNRLVFMRLSAMEPVVSADIKIHIFPLLIHYLRTWHSGLIEGEICVIRVIRYKNISCVCPNKNENDRSFP
jgi:hypothetical protein